MKSRKPLGTVLHLSHSSGNLILETERNVKIGETVLDEAGTNIGAVFDIFGPVSNPFVAVKPRIRAPERLLGKALFSGGRMR
jgi:RNA-binding protein